MPQMYPCYWLIIFLYSLIMLYMFVVYMFFLK